SLLAANAMPRAANEATRRTEIGCRPRRASSPAKWLSSHHRQLPDLNVVPPRLRIRSRLRLGEIVEVHRAGAELVGARGELRQRHRPQGPAIAHRPFPGSACLAIEAP